MKSKKSIRGVVIALAVFTSTLHAAIIITPTAATSSLGNLSNRPIEDAIDGSGLSSGGLSGDILSETHVIGSANDGPYFLGAKGSVLTFDLGNSYTVGAVHIWNYERASETDRGIKSFDMYFSTDGVNFGATPTVSITGVTQGDAVGGIPVQSFSFAEQSGYRYIRLDNIVNWGDASYTGLSEIRFADAIPEPGAALLGGLGLLALLRRRRD